MQRRKGYFTAYGKIATSSVNFFMESAGNVWNSRQCMVQSEMGIYRDNLSAIIIGDNFLSIIVIAQNSLDLSITVIAFVITYILLSPINYREKRFFMHAVFKLQS